MAGTLDLADLDTDEEVVFNAELTAAVEERLADANYGATLSARGLTLVALNDDGELVEYRPDGGSSVIGSDR